MASNVYRLKKNMNKNDYLTSVADETRLAMDNAWKRECVRYFLKNKKKLGIKKDVTEEELMEETPDLPELAHADEFHSAAQDQFEKIIWPQILSFAKKKGYLVAPEVTKKHILGVTLPQVCVGNIFTRV